MKKLKIIFVDKTLVFNLVGNSFNGIFEEKYSEDTLIETLREYLRKLYDDDGFSKISNALIKSLKKMEKEPYKVIIIDSETQTWEKKMSASEYNQIKSYIDGTSNFEKELKIIYSDEFLIFKLPENNVSIFFKEKYLENLIEDTLKKYFRKFYKTNVEKISNALVKSVRNLKRNKYSIITIEKEEKWSKKESEFEYNQIKIQSNKIKTEVQEIESPKEQEKQKLDITTDILKELRKIVEISPNDAQSHNNLAIAYSELGRYDEAIDEFREAISIDSSFPDYYFNLGLNYQKKGSLDLAILEYKETIKLKPNFLQAYMKLGEIYLEQNKFHDAMYTYQRAISVNPSFVYAYIKLSDVCIKLEYVDEAILILQDAFYINPNIDEITTKLIDAYLLRRKLDAIEANNIGIAYAEKGKMEQAISKFQRSIELNPQDAEFHYNLGYAYYKMGETNKAINTLEETLKIDLNFVEAHNILSKIYKEQGKIELYEKEFQAYSKLLKEESKNKQDVEFDNINKSKS